MPDSLSELKRKNLQKRLAALYEEYKAANAQLTRTLSDVDRLRIQRQIADLEQQIQQTESELGQVAQETHDTQASPLAESDEHVKQQLFNRHNFIDLPPDMPLYEKIANLIMSSLGQMKHASMAAAMHILALLALSYLFAWWLVQSENQAIETWQVAAGVWLGLTVLPLVVGTMPQQREKAILSGLAGKQRLALRLEKAFGAYISAFLGEIAAIVILLVLNYLGLWANMSPTSKGIFWFVAEWFTFILSFVGAVIATKYWENLLQKGDPVSLKADHFLLSLGFPLVVCPAVIVFGFATLSLWKEPLFGVPIIAFGFLFLAWQLGRDDRPSAPVDAQPKVVGTTTSEDIPNADRHVKENGLLLSLKQKLTDYDLEMLLLLYQPQKRIPEGWRYQSRQTQIEITRRAVLHTILKSASEGYVDAIWQRLNAQGLVEDSRYNQQIRIGGQYPLGQEIDHTSAVLMELQGSLTPFGRKFAQFVVDSIDVASANN